MAFMGYLSENLNKFNTTSEKRGRDYFYQGAVKSLSFDGTNATAIVSGTSEYSVSANFDGHRLKSWSCSCPYSLGGACKHVVALLCALDDRESSLGRQKGASGDKARENRDYVEASNLVQDAFAYGGYLNTYQIRRLLVCFRGNSELSKAFIISFLNSLLSTKGSYYFSSDLTFFFECFKNSKLTYSLFPSIVEGALQHGSSFQAFAIFCFLHTLRPLISQSEFLDIQAKFASLKGRRIIPVRPEAGYFRANCDADLPYLSNDFLVFICQNDSFFFSYLKLISRIREANDPGLEKRCFEAFASNGFCCLDLLDSLKLKGEDISFAYGAIFESLKHAASFEDYLHARSYLPDDYARGRIFEVINLSGLDFVDYVRVREGVKLTSKLTKLSSALNLALAYPYFPEADKAAVSERIGKKIDSFLNKAKISRELGPTLGAMADGNVPCLALYLADPRMLKAKDENPLLNPFWAYAAVKLGKTAPFNFRKWELSGEGER